VTFVTQDRGRAHPVRRSFRLQRGARDRPAPAPRGPTTARGTIGIWQPHIPHVASRIRPGSHRPAV